jgi:hypothetical protein
MLIRIVTTRADISPTGEDIAFVHGEIQPHIAEMDGNKGFAMALDRSSGRYVGIATWSDAETLEASGQGGLDLIADIARRLHGSEPSVEVFDLVLAQVVKPVRVGHWGRLVRSEVPVRDSARGTQRFARLLPALFEHHDGLAAIVLFADRSRGALGCVIWCDSLHVLRRSASRTEELRELLVADVPTMRFVEDSELEAVIAEMTELSSSVSAPYTWN